MSKVIDTKTIIILILSAILFYQNCNPNEEISDVVSVNGKKYGVIKYTTDTITNIKTNYYTKKGEDIFYESVKVDTVEKFEKIDTLKVLAEFFTKNRYKDTIRLPDSLGYVYIDDIIYKNKIDSRTVKSNVVERIVDNNHYLKEMPKAEYYIGVNLTGNKNNYINTVGTGLLIKSVSNNILQVNVGLLNENTIYKPYIGGGYYWRINK